MASDSRVIVLSSDDDESVLPWTPRLHDHVRRSQHGDEIVDVWDGPRQTHKRSLDERKPPPMPSPLVQVLEIFPDVDVNFVKKKLAEQRDNVEIVVAVISENEDYPKQKKNSNAENISGTSNRLNNKNIIIRRTKYAEPKYDYSSPSAVFDISPAYQTEVVELLLYDFSFLRQKAVSRLLKQCSGRYTLTRNFIHNTIIGKSPNDVPVAAAAGSAEAIRAEKEEVRNYRLLRSILLRGSKPPEEVEKRFEIRFLKKVRVKIGSRQPTVTDPILMDEHFHYEKRFQEWIEKVKSRLQSQWANKEALENGTAVQCLCCFDDIALSECVACKEKGHLFCKDCIVQYVESQVFGSGNLGIDRVNNTPAMEIKCCEGSGCNSGFRDEDLQKLLPAKTWEKYSEMQAKVQIEKAGLGGNLAMCPKCGYQAEVPELQNIFECPIEGCRFSSCRKCGKASHIPLRCDEVIEKNRQEEGRLKIEEALSEAKMRECPKCKKKFIKSDGCNKMTCACGMKICYVCRKPLDGNPYAHFCQTPHCDHSSCGKCKLYTNDEEDDAQAMREAGIAAKVAFEASVRDEDQAAGRSTSVVKLKVDVDEMMRHPSPVQNSKKRKRSRQPRATQNNPPRVGHRPVRHANPVDGARRRINERIQRR